MILLEKRRILFVVSMVFVSLFSYLSAVTYNKETIQTMGSPVSGKVVVVDAGHGGEDGGASSGNGTTEADINLSIALKVQDEKAIYDLDSKTLRQKKVSDIKNRVKIGNEASADIFVSVHLNKIPQSQYYGWQTFYKQSDEQSKKLATCIQSSLNEAIQKENKRVPLKIDNIYIIDNVEVPTSIVECGFLSNPEEEKQLLNDEYQGRLAWGIYTGIMDYFYQ